MEKRSRRRIRDLVAPAAFQGLSQNEIGCARISMMARSTNAPFKGRIQKRKTNRLQIIKSSLQRTAGATHGRSIQRCHFRTHALRQKHPSRRTPRSRCAARTMLNEIARNKLDEAGADRRTARPCTSTKCGRAAPPLQGSDRVVLRCGSPLPGSQQRLPRAGKWNSCGRGTPYGVTYTHFAVVSRSAASKCQ
jgi:hypothetical protein